MSCVKKYVNNILKLIKLFQQPTTWNSNDKMVRQGNLPGIELCRKFIRIITPDLEQIPHKVDTLGVKQVRLVSVKAERPSHPSRSHARQGGPSCGVVVVMVGGGGPPRRQQWWHVHDSIRPIHSTYSRARPKKTKNFACSLFGVHEQNNAREE